LTYVSAANFTGTDTFTYSVGTVTINVAAEVWYVDNSFSGSSTVCPLCR
jgi:hypothetical protein